MVFGLRSPLYELSCNHSPSDLLRARSRFALKFGFHADAMAGHVCLAIDRVLASAVVLLLQSGLIQGPVPCRLVRVRCCRQWPSKISGTFSWDFRRRDRPNFRCHLLLFLQIWIFSLWCASYACAEESTWRIWLRSGTQVTLFPTWRVCVARSLFSFDVDVALDAKQLLLLRRVYPVERNFPLPSIAGWVSVHYAPIGACVLPIPLQTVAQTPSQVHQSAHVWCVSWKFGRYNPYDSYTSLPYGQCYADMQRVDLHGFWIDVCLLVDVDSFWICVALGWFVSKIRLWHPRWPSCSPQCVQMELWSLVYVVWHFGRNLSRSQGALPQDLQRECVTVLFLLYDVQIDLPLGQCSTADR